MHYASSGKMYYHLFIFFIIFITLNYVTLPVDRKKFTFVDKIVSRYSIHIYIYIFQNISRQKYVRFSVRGLKNRFSTFSSCKRVALET